MLEIMADPKSVGRTSVKTETAMDRKRPNYLEGGHRSPRNYSFTVSHLIFLFNLFIQCFYL